MRHQSLGERPDNHAPFGSEILGIFAPDVLTRVHIIDKDSHVVALCNWDLRRCSAVTEFNRLAERNHIVARACTARSTDRRIKTKNFFTDSVEVWSVWIERNDVSGACQFM